MAIKGLTDRGLSFPEIGQIRKGAKKTDNAPGRDLTYFRVEFDENEKESSDKFFSIYGEQPTEIRIVLPFNDIERMWDAWLEGYTAGRMVARSDGDHFTYLIDTQTGEFLVKGGLDVKTGLPKPYIDGQVVGYWTDKNNKKHPVFCKPVGRLKVIVPELGRAAYLTVMTTSTHDIGNISAQLDAFKAVNNGLIAGIPLILRRRPKKISCPNADGTRARRVKWMLSIEADPQWMAKMIGHLNTLALPGGNEFVALPNGEEVEVTPDEFNEPDDEIQDAEFTEAEPEQPAQEPAGNGNKQPAQATTRQQPAQTKAPTASPAKPAPAKPAPTKPAQPAATNDKPDDKAWTAWYKLVGDADAMGVVTPEPPDDVTTADLRKLYGQVKADMEAAKQFNSEPTN